jgi:hypothetical protein
MPVVGRMYLVSYFSDEVEVSAFRVSPRAGTYARRYRSLLEHWHNEIRTTNSLDALVVSEFFLVGSV